jgi:hypothetical protein
MRESREEELQKIWGSLKVRLDSHPCLTSRVGLPVRRPQGLASKPGPKHRFTRGRGVCV